MALRIVGYFTSWGIESQGYTPSKISAGKLTHLNYAFSAISPAGNRCALGDPYADVERIYTAQESVGGEPDEPGGLHGSFNQLLKLKRKYPYLKTLISIGGWTGSGRFSEIALTEASRREFAASCLELYFRQYPGVFDGIDIDWEFPVAGGLEAGRPEDQRNFTLLLAELRRQLEDQGRVDGQPYLLTIAASARPGEIANLELDRIPASLDWINLMAYDFHIIGERVTNFNAPLYPAPDDPSLDPVTRDYFNVDSAVKAYLEAGVPAEKLVLGVPFYGRGWQGVPDANHGLYQPASGPAPGTLGEGVLGYTDLVRDVLPDYRRYFHETAKVPWLYRPEDGVFISYDDPESIGLKADYAVEHGLGGLMFWELSNDGGVLLEILHKKLAS